VCVTPLGSKHEVLQSTVHLAHPRPLYKVYRYASNKKGPGDESSAKGEFRGLLQVLDEINSSGDTSKLAATVVGFYIRSTVYF